MSQNVQPLFQFSPTDSSHFTFNPFTVLLQAYNKNILPFNGVLISVE